MKEILLEMKVDTGAILNLINKQVYKKHFKHLPLSTCYILLKTVSEETLPVKGIMEVSVAHSGEKVKLSVIVCKFRAATPLGRQWLDMLQSIWRTALEIKCVEMENKDKL